MTVSYSGSFALLLLRWRGSLWKTLWKDLLAFLVAYYAISFVYRFGMPEGAMVFFEKSALMCNEYCKQFPLHFLLGFYVGLVVKRWWEQFELLPWPDNIMYWVSGYIRGTDDRAVFIRTRIARYIMLSTTLAMRNLSVRILKRFPTLDHVEIAGFMTKTERAMIEEMKTKHTPYDAWFLPLNWIQSIVVECFDKERRIQTSIELRQLIQELETYRKGFDKLFIYDWVSIPLLYTQLCTVCTYGFFALCLIGRQYLRPEKSLAGSEVDLYVPVFTILQFLLFIGWLKVAEDIINPLGDDDEDFELNYLLDRHCEMAFLIAGIHSQLPPEERTKLDFGPGFQPAAFQPAKEVFTRIPHTRASMRTPDTAPPNHLNAISVSRKESEVIIDDTATDVLNVNLESSQLDLPASTSNGYANGFLHHAAEVPVPSPSLSRPGNKRWRMVQKLIEMKNRVVVGPADLVSKETTVEVYTQRTVDSRF